MSDGTSRLRIALIDDHEVVALGFVGILADSAALDVVATATTVDALPEEAWPLDLAVLDLRLQDGSRPQDNVAALHKRGAKVLVLTSGEDAALARAAARAGVLGIVRKSEPVADIVAAIEAAARGETVPTTEWAAALDADERLPDARLSEREQEILALYASGEKAHAVAFKTGLSPSTVTHYVARIRTKYALVGRPARTKIELNTRAREDGLLAE